MSNKVTEIKVFPLKGNHKTIRANGNCLIGGMVQVRFTIMEGSNGLFVSLPRRQYKDKDGETKWSNEVYIPDETLHTMFQKAIIEEYNNIMGGKGQGTAGEEQQYHDSVPF